MRWGITSGSLLSATLPYIGAIETACDRLDFPYSLAYAIAWRESIHGEVAGLWPSAAAVVSPDGGHGLFQLTSWVPDTWATPQMNAFYAIQDWLEADAVHYFRTYDLTGEKLVVAVAVAFNAGRLSLIGRLLQAAHSADEGAHALDRYTTDNYATAILALYRNLVKTGKPDGA